MKTLVLNAVVVTALVGGVTAYATFNNTVHLSIDGKTETVDTFSDTVEGVLADQGIEVGEHDEVVPSLESPIQDDSKIDVRYGRQVLVTVDGVEKEVWTTALSVDEALGVLGLRDPAADVSVSRSLGIGRQGLDFEIRTSKDITLVADGEERDVETTAVTVREALRDLDVTLGDRDLIEPGPEERLEVGSVVTIKRVTVEEKTVTLTVDYETTRKNDDSMYEDESEVEREGSEGELERVIEVIYIDGEESEEQVLSEKVVVEAVNRVVLEGTKERPEEPPPSDDGGDDGGDAGVWDQLAQCESGGDWSINTGNGYYGGLQFSLGTWEAYGGSGYPHENSKSEQIRIATKVRDARGGYGDWPACASKLGLPL